MSLQINAKKDYDNINKIAQNFVKFYYDNLNLKNYNNILNVIREHTILNFDNKLIKGYDILKFYKHIFNNKHIKYNINKFITTHKGSRAINILVNGSINERKFTEYIFFGQGNDKKFWIKSSMILFIN